MTADPAAAVRRLAAAFLAAPGDEPEPLHALAARIAAVTGGVAACLRRKDDALDVHVVLGGGRSHRMVFPDGGARRRLACAACGGTEIGTMPGDPRGDAELVCLRCGGHRGWSAA
jgi:hypothetical protein